MKMIEGDGKVDIFNYILAMRRHRSYMVQTEVSCDPSHDSHVTSLSVIVCVEAVYLHPRRGAGGDKDGEHRGFQPEPEEDTEAAAGTGPADRDQSSRGGVPRESATSTRERERERERERGVCVRCVPLQRLNGLVEVDESTFSYAMNPLNMPKNREPKILPRELLSPLSLWIMFIFSLPSLSLDHVHLLPPLSLWIMLIFSLPSPVDMYRVRLIMAPGLSCSDYINASYVDVSSPSPPLSLSLSKHLHDLMMLPPLSLSLKCCARGTSTGISTS